MPPGETYAIEQYKIIIIKNIWHTCLYVHTIRSVVQFNHATTLSIGSWDECVKKKKKKKTEPTVTTSKVQQRPETVEVKCDTESWPGLVP